MAGAWLPWRSSDQQEGVWEGEAHTNPAPACSPTRAVPSPKHPALAGRRQARSACAPVTPRGSRRLLGSRRSPPCRAPCRAPRNGIPSCKLAPSAVGSCRSSPPNTQALATLQLACSMASMRRALGWSTVALHACALTRTGGRLALLAGAASQSAQPACRQAPHQAGRCHSLRAGTEGQARRSQSERRRRPKRHGLGEKMLALVADGPNPRLQDRAFPPWPMEPRSVPPL